MKCCYASCYGMRSLLERYYSKRSVFPNFSHTNALLLHILCRYLFHHRKLERDSGRNILCFPIDHFVSCHQYFTTDIETFLIIYISITIIFSSDILLNKPVVNSRGTHRQGVIERSSRDNKNYSKSERKILILYVNIA